jgi:cysteine desulfuration protein SufE
LPALAGPSAHPPVSSPQHRLYGERGRAYMKAGSDAVRAFAIAVASPAAASGDQTMTIDEIVDNFSLLDDWDDRYRYVIELGRNLTPLPDEARNDTNKVQGCASQVWLDTKIEPDGKAGPVLTFRGDSDAHIVRGLIAILLALYSGKPARDIVETDAIAVFERLALREHLTPQRSNGFRSMVERIKSDARSALVAA